MANVTDVRCLALSPGTRRTLSSAVGGWYLTMQMSQSWSCHTRRTRQAVVMLISPCWKTLPFVRAEVQTDSTLDMF